MRVSLVNAFKWVATHTYGMDNFAGVRLDIWGDGVLRGNLDTTRMCFRLLAESTSEIQYHCQSRNEIFTFAVFLGKDSLMNLEINLGPNENVRDRGWLYDETKELADEGVIITLY